MNVASCKVSLCIGISDNIKVMAIAVDETIKFEKVILVGQIRVFVLLIKRDAFWIFSSLNHGCGCAKFTSSTTY